MSTTIKIRNLNQYYGKKQALRDVNLTIQTGMFGLLGRNGAGKTTLMKVIATLLPLSEGEVSVCARSTRRPQEVRKIVGYLPQDFSMSQYDRVRGDGLSGSAVRAWQGRAQEPNP